MSDGCSIPAPLKRLIPALQTFADKCDGTACKVHDEAYARGGTTAERIEADYVLFQAARDVVGDTWAAIIFDAVRLYGATSWSVGPWHGGERAWPEAQQAP